MKLNETQQKIVNTNKSKVIIMSAPASGKTAVLTERVKFLLNKGANPQGIVVITFTRAAAETMRKRIGEIGKDVFIGTIHAYANYLLLKNQINTIDVIQEEEFDALFELVSENPQCLEEVEYLLVDEVQDCDANQFNFLLSSINPKNYFFVGDVRQTIYEWRNSRPDILFNLINEEDVTVYSLNQNYRSCKEIISFAGSIINKLGPRYQDNTIPMREKEGKVITAQYTINNLIGKILYTSGEFKDWFVLTRTNEQLQDVYNDLVAQGIPCDALKKSDLEKGSLSEKMSKNSVKIMTIHAAKGLESKNVAVIGAYVAPSDSESYRIAYVAATRAKDTLIWYTNKKRRKVKTMCWE